jgi:ceramide glucosyltransferase
LLDDKAVLRRLWLVPLQDLLSFITWIGGFTGREISWRNERYRLLAGGRFTLVSPRGIYSASE